MTTIMVTGSGGLIGSEAARFYLSRGYTVVGIDDDHRSKFFGPNGTVKPMIESLMKIKGYIHQDIDIQRYPDVIDTFFKYHPDVVIHCAAQPSHDRAAQIPHEDFHTNATGTLNLLESTRQTSIDIPFVHVSTNKVYGDNPNRLSMIEERTRYQCSDPRYMSGIDESMSIDSCTHSLFGVSKLAGDVLAQEYGRYFGMKTGIFRGGCLTGENHAGVALHGFLSYLVKCAVHRLPYTIIGYNGKQVRDQIHSHDVVTCFDSFIEDPGHGEVYNLGGESENSVSVLESINMIQTLGHELSYDYVDNPRVGDHRWYVSDMSKFRSRYPNWKKLYTIDDIVTSMVRHSEKD